jgi:hypothetical protein
LNLGSYIFLFGVFSFIEDFDNAVVVVLVADMPDLFCIVANKFLFGVMNFELY